MSDQYQIKLIDGVAYLVQPGEVGARLLSTVEEEVEVGEVFRPRWVTGRYYDVGSSMANTFSSGTYTTGTLIATPIYVPNTNTVDRIGVGVSGTAAQTCRMGIYANGTDGNPGALIVETSTVSVAVTSAMAEATISQELTGGTWYWVAITFSGLTGAIFRLIPQGSTIGAATLASTANESFAVDQAFTYGAL